ncbi:diguanylate cyclase [Lysinibacillus contaminans]|uniref:Diguanylate cyclase n=1 Tax=Lysinibacillus contaminans TaxID=1293441 RepID=A0ABR5JY28_9BACI|nr:dipeptidase [Lysinibacillus contaminans]KOS67551.1 diguanylate cyclase [Lysinibacillus contaminans]
MDIIDLHCDVLMKLTTLETANFKDDERLQSNKGRLQLGQVKAQVFAIFIDPKIPQSMKFLEVMRQIEAFHMHVLQTEGMVHITDWSQLECLAPHEIGAILSLEGCDAIGDDITKLQAVLDAGVKLVGLTWNGENSVAYGAEQDAKLGLKPFGKEVVNILNERDIIIDVSHLNEQGFWDVLPLAKHIIASHSNARALCDHPRNLTDKQARALVEHGGHIHVVYYPHFIGDNASMEDLVAHVKHFADLVGVEHLGLGSDFDGIDVTVDGLAHAGEAQNLLEALREHFSIEEVRGIANANFRRYINYALA